MGPVYVQLSRYIEYGVKHNGKDPRFKFGDFIPAKIC